MRAAEVPRPGERLRVAARSRSPPARTPPETCEPGRWRGTTQHPDEKVTFVELPEDADQQRAQMIQNAQTKSDAYNVLNLDVVWTSEFAANR